MSPCLNLRTSTFYNLNNLPHIYYTSSPDAFDNEWIPTAEYWTKENSLHEPSDCWPLKNAVVFIFPTDSLPKQMMFISQVSKPLTLALWGPLPFIKHNSHLRSAIFALEMLSPGSSWLAICSVVKWNKKHSRSEVSFDTEGMDLHVGFFTCCLVNLDWPLISSLSLSFLTVI